MTGTATHPARRQASGGLRLATQTRITAPVSALRWTAGSVWLVPMLSTAALGWYKIGAPVMWRDELATWQAASRSVPQLWRMVHNVDAVLGIYYLGLHFWMAVFGDSPAAMRAPSLIAMTGTAGLVALIGRRLGGNTAGIAGGMVFALIPSVSRYAQEARPYALVTFFGALATLLLLRALERPRWQRWVLYGLAIAATGACNLVALCLLAGHLICVVIHCCRPPKGSAGRRWGVVPGFCLAALAGVALDTPIIIEGHRQAAEQLGGHSRPALSQLTGLTGSLGMWPQLFSSTAVAAIVIMLAVASLGGPRRRASVYSLTAALVPVVILWCASQGPVSYWYIRYLLFTVPAWAVAAGLGIAGVAAGATALCSRSLRWAGQRRAALGSAGPGPAGPRWATLRSAGLWRVAAVAVMLALVAAAGGPAQGEIRQAEAHNWWSYPDPSGAIPADYQGAANVIAEHEKPGDGIVFKRDDRWMVDTGVYYYLRGRAKPTDVFLVKTPVQAAGLEAVECAHPALCLHGDPRLWVVYQGVTVGPYAAIEPAKAAALHAAGYATQHIYEEDGITVALMIRA